jgi:outer membrane protein TolC
MRKRCLWLLGPVILCNLCGRAAAQEVSFPKLTLQEAVARAVNRNPNVLVAAAEVRRAAALFEQVRAAALPTLSGNGLYTRIDGNRTFGSYIVTPADQVNANLTLSVPLLAPPAWAQWAQKRESERIAALSQGAVRRQVAIAVGHAYLALIAQRRVVELNERARDTAQAHFEFTRKRFTQGIGSKLDEVRAEQELRSDEGQVESAQAARLRAQAALSILLGEEQLYDAAEDPVLPEFPETGSALAEAPRLRPDLLALDRSHLLATHLVRDSYTDFLPTLVASFAPLYQYPSLTQYPMSIAQPTFGWQFQLTLTVPFYDGGLRYGLLHERRALADEAEVNRLAGLRLLRVDIDVGTASLRKAEQAALFARRAAELAHKAVDIATLSYRTGASTNLEVIDAERRARDADTAAVLAINDVTQIRLDLLAAAGRFP